MNHSKQINKGQEDLSFVQNKLERDSGDFSNKFYQNV